jgi:Double zinc ribbon
MDCSSCGHPNREGARFCAQCATPLVNSVTCPSCGTAHPAAARHCDSCGQALSGAGAPAGGREETGGAAMAAGRDPRAYTPEHLAERIRGSRADLEGERKQVTVLFADVIGSMDLAERTDPEVWRRIMERFFVILCDGVHRFEGTVDKFSARARLIPVS